MHSTAALMLLPALLVAGCAATPENGPQNVRFACDGGTMLALAFMPDHAMLRAGDAPPVRLEQQRVASGFAYAGPDQGGAVQSIRGKGRALDYTSGNTPPEHCTEIED